VSAITIVRNAPPPPSHETRGRKPGNRTANRPHRRYPWAELRVGDAFDVPITPLPPMRDNRHPEHNAITAVVSKRNRDAGERGPRYIARLMDDFRVRVWRIA
jgi:hypothetical protein